MLRGCVRVLPLLADDDLAEFVKLLHFGRGEGAIVDADVVDSSSEVTMVLFCVRSNAKGLRCIWSGRARSGRVQPAHH